MYLLILIIVSLLLFLLWASADIGSNVYVRTLCRGVKNKRVVAITFDDGPDERMTPEVLDILREYGVRATFFLTGKNVGKNPEIAGRMVEEGHIVANHTYTHSPSFTFASARQVDKDLEACNEAIFSATGRRPLLFRPPYGVTNPPIGRTVRKRGLVAVGWSIRSLDTMKNRSRTDVCRRVLRRLRPGAVILLHDRCEGCTGLLRTLLPAIKERGYRFVSLDEMLNVKAYED